MRPQAGLRVPSGPADAAFDAMLAVLFLAGLAVAGWLALGCASAPKVVSTVVDVSDAICEQLRDQPEPDWVVFGCSMVDAVSGDHTTFKAKVRKEDAPAFAARRCAEGEVAP